MRNVYLSFHVHFIAYHFIPIYNVALSQNPFFVRKEVKEFELTDAVITFRLNAHKTHSGTNRKSYACIPDYQSNCFESVKTVSAIV